MTPFPLRAALILSALSLVGCTTIGTTFSPLAAFEQSHVFVPSKYPYGNWHPKDLELEDAWFDSADGTHLHGWYCPHEKPRAVVLFLHGNAGNITHTAEYVRSLHDLHQLTVLSLDYRGFGRSEGVPTETGVLADARAARAWLAKRTGVRECDILLMGHSLGGGVAVDLAAKDNCRGLILASTFTSMPDAAAHHLPYLPTNVLMRNRFDSLRKIDQFHGPLLMVHGDRDRVVPYEQGKKLFAKANEPKRFVTNAGGDHMQLVSKEFVLSFDEFLKALPAPQDEAKQP